MSVRSRSVSIHIAESQYSWWQQHKLDWRECQRCPLSSVRTQVVLLKGQIPSDYLFIGEGPWIVEDIQGIPFAGPAGQQMSKMIAECGLDESKCCFTNIIGCKVDGEKPRPPSKEEAEKCRPRLKEVIEHCRPKLVILLGQPAAKYASTQISLKTPQIHLAHPASILYMTTAKATIASRRWVLQLTQALANLPH